MRKHRLKLFFASILTMCLICITVVVVLGIANLVAYFQSSADPAAILNIIPNTPPNTGVDIQWHPDDPLHLSGREMEPFTRTQIASAYERAWLQWNISLLRNEPYGLRTYFAGPALDAIQESIPASDELVEQTNTSHRLRLHFYSADGSIVSLSDEAAYITRIVYGTDGKVIHAVEYRCTFDIVLMLEDGNWRIRHMVQRSAKEAFSEISNTKPSMFVSQHKRKLLLNGEPYHVAGINYYPQATPWNLFWQHYDAEVIARDFDKIRDLGLNSVRVFVPFEQFGGSDVDPIMLAHLDDLLDQAEARQIKVVVTLFDFYTGYDLLLWPKADRHLETIVSRFADHPAVLAWDVKNEPDRDYAAHGQVVVETWLKHVIRLVREHAPNHLVTIGWSTPIAAEALASDVDIVSFHYYAPAERFAEAYVTLQDAAPDRPLLLSEFGLSTWNSPFFPHGHSEAEQAQYYADILTTLRTTDGGGALSWTLYDFEHVPTNVVGHAPWKTGPEYYYGLLRTDGSVKPVAALMSPTADLDVPSVPSWSRFTKPFWRTIWMLLIVLLLLGWWYQRRVHRPHR